MFIFTIQITLLLMVILYFHSDCNPQGVTMILMDHMMQTKDRILRDMITGLLHHMYHIAVLGRLFHVRILITKAVETGFLIVHHLGEIALPSDQSRVTSKSKIIYVFKSAISSKCKDKVA